MKGLLLAEKYYETYGKAMIHDKFSNYENQIAVGLVGEGSECFGYDDNLSMDHDFGPGFCLWLTDNEYKAIGSLLQEAYDNLPKNYLGYQRIPSQQSGQRAGVFCISDFYRKFIGNVEDLSTEIHWLYIPEHMLATAVNGKVFHDPLGEFSKIRTYLQHYYPEDIRVKKIAARFALMAQSGQYNYYRSIQRKEYVAARLALDIFVRESISLSFLLNKAYMPYYKWSFRRLNELPIMKQVMPLIHELSVISVTEDYVVGNYIETICQEAINETAIQGLITENFDFLDYHTPEIMSHIKNPTIRNLHVMQG